MLIHVFLNETIIITCIYRVLADISRILKNFFIQKANVALIHLAVGPTNRHIKVNTTDFLSGYHNFFEGLQPLQPHLPSDRPSLNF